MVFRAVRGVGRGRHLFQSVLLLHHESDLLFGRVTGPDHRLLDVAGRVLGNHMVMVRGGQENSATGVAELERALRVASVEDRLDRDGRRPMTLDQLGDRVVDLTDPVR